MIDLAVCERSEVFFPFGLTSPDPSNASLLVLRGLMREIADDLFAKWGCEILEMKGEADYVHILFDAPPQVQLSKIINSFKTVSSRYIRKEFEKEIAPYYWKPYFWSHSYMTLTTGGATIDVVRQYIENQGEK
ncbi:MAG: IS200/IS605 family transposase [Lysinibacillus sp.]